MVPAYLYELHRSDHKRKSESCCRLYQGAYYQVCYCTNCRKKAPKGRSMGHAGAIVSSDGTGSAAHKEQVFRDAGAVIAESTQHIAEILTDLKKNRVLS